MFNSIWACAPPKTQINTLLSFFLTSHPISKPCWLLQAITRVQPLIAITPAQAIIISLPDYGHSILSQLAWNIKDGHQFIVLLSTPLILTLASDCFSQLHIEEGTLC